MGPLRLLDVEDAILVPSGHDGIKAFDGGVLRSDLSAVQDASLTRNWRGGWSSPPPSMEGTEPDAIEEPHLYGGPFFDHFGHFILESLARLWALEEVGPMPVAWASGGPPNRWQREILSLLGIGSLHVFPKRPTRFRRLVVPEPGFRIQGEFHPRHAAFLGRVAPAAEGGSERIWLSRSDLGADRRSEGEEEVQDVLAARGWRIVHPERLSVTEQLRLLSCGNVLAGLRGSAFHPTALLSGSRARLVLLHWGHNVNQQVISERRGIPQIDVHGAFQVNPRSGNKRDLFRPRRVALRVDALAGRVEACGDDEAGLRALRREVGRTHGETRARWEQRARTWLRLGA